MTSFPRLILFSLLLSMLAGAVALGQGQPPFAPGYNGFGPGGFDPGGFGPGGYGPVGPGAGYYGGYGPQSGGGSAYVPHLGNTSFTITGAVEGLGYQGSYFSAQSTFPIGGMDPLHGWWLIDARINVSERGLPFTNVGLVRRTHFRPMDADFGIGVYHDMDADQYEDYGHTFQQVGVSANMWTPNFDLNFNGYIPVGETNYTQASSGECFYENFIVLQYGLDSALTGFEFDFGLRPDWWAARSGQFNAGVYAYQSDSVDPFAGFRGSFSFQPKPGLRLLVGLTADDQFDTSGIFQIEFIRGRSRGLTPSGRDLDPMIRNTHIVRAHQTPILATNPETGELYRVVHVDNSAADGGDGTFERPFNELSDADGTLPPFIVDGGLNGNRFREQPRSLPFDIIFVNEGLSRDLNGTPFNPLDDLPGNLTGYDTGIALLEGQMLLGDGVQHIIPTVEKGNYILCNDQDGLTPYISNGIHFPTPTSGTQPNRAAVTLADNTTVRGFNIVNSEIGILAPDPTPNLNNNDGIEGNIVIERVNIFINNQFDPNDLVRNTGDVLDPDVATIDVPLKYGISILDSTANYFINNVNIKGQNVPLPPGILDDGAGGSRVINLSPNGNLVAALNIERGTPVVFFNGIIDNTFNVLRQTVLDDGDPLTIDPIVQTQFATLSAGGRAVRIVDTTGGDIFIDGLINNVQGQGIMINNADNTTITIDSMVMINQSLNEAISVFNSDNSVVEFTNQQWITDPLVAGVHLADNTDTEFTFFDLSVTTPANQAALDAGLPLPNTPVTGFLAQRNDFGMITVSGKSLLDIVGGPALSVAGTDLAETPIDMTFTRLRSVSSADGGVLLANVSGAFRSTRTTITDSAGTGIFVRSNDGDPLQVDFGQTLIAPSVDAAGVVVGVQGPGVRLQNNPSANISFDQLSVTTTNGTALAATGGGTLNLNSIAILNATNGAALNLQGITGTFQNAPGLVFGDLTSGDPANPGVGSPTFGVQIVDVVNDVDITGTTTIDSNADAGVYIAGGIDDVRFGVVNITNRLNVGVLVEEIGGNVRIASANIDNANAVAGNAINIIDTYTNGNQGNVAIMGGLITDAENDGIHIENSIATIANVSIRAPGAAQKHDGISVVTNGVNDAIVWLRDNTVFLDDGDVGVRLLSNGTGTLNATVTDNLLIGNETLDPLIDNIASIHATSVSGTLFLNAIENHDGDGTSPTNPIHLEDLGGTLDVTQTSAGNLSALNNNVDVEIDGVVNFGAGNPPLPPPVPAN